MPLAEYLLLAVASAFWPLLLAVVAIALHTQHPVRVLAWFLVGAQLTTMAVGCAIVFLLDGASFLSGDRPAADAPVDLVVGALALIAAFVMWSRPSGRGAETGGGDAARWQGLLAGDARLAFLAGIVLDVIPGVFPFVALKGLAEASYSVATTVTLIAVFYVIMFAFVEVPLVCYLVAPDRTAAAVHGFNRWLDLNRRRLAVWVLALVGAYLVVRGLLLL